MKNLLFVILLLIVGLRSYNQTSPPTSDYTSFVSGQWNRGYFKALGIEPGGATPSFKIKQWPHSGQLYLDSVNNIFYFYSSGAWRALAAGGAGTMVSVSGLSPLFTVTNPTTSAVFNLSNVGSYHLFGRALGTGPPSYLSSIDSNWIPTLHTQEYYDARYTTMFGASSTLIFNSPLEKFGNDVFVDYISPTWNAAWIQSHPVQAIQPLQGQTIIYDSASGILKWQYPDSIAAEIANNKVDSVTFIPGINTDSVFYWVEDTATLAGIIDQKCGLISPGSVVHDSLLSFTVSPSIHKSCCDGVRYTTDLAHPTLDAADPTNDRIDVIALEGDQVVVVTGTPSATPAKPQLTDCQTELTFIYIPALATEPGGTTVIDTAVIYDQNLPEWTISTSGITIDADNTVDPYHLTKAISTGAITSASTITFTSSSEYQKSAYSSLRFFTKLKSVFTQQTRFQIYFLNNGVVVSNNVFVTNGTYGFTRTNISTYQEIIIPIADWIFNSNTFDAIAIKSTGTNINGFYLDWVTLTGGIPQQQIQHPNSFGIVTTTSGTATSTQPNDVLNIIGSGGITTSASGKTVTISGSAGGVTTMGTFGSSPNAEGGTISGSTLTLQPASGTFPGGVTTGTQTFAGDKNLAGNTTLTKYAVGWQFVVTSAGTETLTNTSLYATSFTGTTTHTLVLPDATTLKLGQLYRVRNNSTGSITINKNGGSNLLTLTAGNAVLMIVTDISGAAGTWEYEISSPTGGGISGTITGTRFAHGDGSGGLTTTSGYEMTSGFIADFTYSRSNQKYFWNSSVSGSNVKHFGIVNENSLDTDSSIALRFASIADNLLIQKTNFYIDRFGHTIFGDVFNHDGLAKYYSNRSSSYDDRSLVDKRYVDSSLATVSGGGNAFTKGATIESPSSSENVGLGWKTPVDITVTSVVAVVVGSSTPSVTFNIAFGTDRTSGTNVFSSGQVTTSQTSGHTFNSGFNDATIPAGSWIWFTTSAQSGTVNQIEITINYTED